MAADVEKIVPPHVVAEGMVIILAIVSILIGCFLAYVAYLTFSRSRRPRREAHWVHGPLFLVVVAVSLGGVYVATKSEWWLVGSQPLPSGIQTKSPAILMTSLALLATMALCALYYFRKVRDRWNDDRIRYAVLLWASSWLLTALVLIPLWWTSDHLEFEITKVSDESFSQFIGVVVQLASFIITAMVLVVTIRSQVQLANETSRDNAEQARLTARQQIYQTLELSSVDLFRFECLHPEIAGMIWSDDENKPTSINGKAITPYQVKEYLCQTLNLFEMAFRFRQENIFEAEIFGSWVIWMWELCERQPFQDKWNDEDDPVRFNYLPKFQDIMDAGIYYATEDPRPDGADPRRSFFRYVARATGDWQHLEKWLDQKRGGNKAEYRKHWTDANGLCLDEPFSAAAAQSA